jgi:site-specific DNA recombinase
MRAALYARYSSDNQRIESITAQLRACHDFCHKKNYDIVKEYKDEALSGRSDNRPAFQQLISDAKLGLFEIVVFHKIDRTARDEADYYTFKKTLKKSKVKIAYADQNIDDSPEGELQEGILVSMAAYYSRNLAKEAMKGMRENAYMAKHNGGKPPLGYDVKNGDYIINESEAEIVRLIFSMRANGDGYSEILDALNLHGYKTKAGNTFGKNSLADLLRNKKYIGTYVFGRVATQDDGTRNNHKTDENVIEIPNAIPAIIDMDTWDRVRLRISAAKSTPGIYKAKEVYNLSGMIKCACGATMIGSRVTSRGNTYVYYQCDNQHRKRGCDVPRIKRDEIEDLVYDKIHLDILASDKRTELLLALNAEKEKLDTERTSAMKSLEKRKEELTKQANNLLDFIAEGNASPLIKRRFDDASTKLAEIEHQIEVTTKAFRKEYLSEKQLLETLNDLEKIEKGTEKTRSLFEIFVHSIVVTKEEIHIQLRFGFEWWRRGESNPCPKISLHKILRAQLVI